MSKDKFINIVVIFFAVAATYTLRAGTRPIMREVKAPPALTWRPAAAKFEEAAQRLDALESANLDQIETGALRFASAPTTRADAPPATPVKIETVTRRAATASLAPKSAPQTGGAATSDFQERMEQYAIEVERAAAQGKEPPPRWRYVSVADLTPIGRIVVGGKSLLIAEIRDEQSTQTLAVGTALGDAQLVDVTHSTAVFRLANGEVRTLRFAKQKAQMHKVYDKAEIKDGNTAAQTDTPKEISQQKGELPASAETDDAKPKETVTINPQECRSCTPSQTEKEAQKGAQEPRKSAFLEEERAKPTPHWIEIASLVPTGLPVGSTPAPEERRPSLCDPTAHGEPLTIDGLTRPIAFQTLIEQLNQTFGANIVLEPEIQDLPIKVAVRDLPWMDLVRTVAEWNDLVIDCNENMVRIMRRARRQQIEQARRQQEPLTRRVFKLKYVQPSQSVRVNLAGQPADTSGATAPTVASLEEAIRAILRAGDGRGDVRRVPGRNELIVAATAEQMREIEELIARVDRPTYQVVIRTLVYTVNENRLRDVGLQIDGIITGRAGRTVGGIVTTNVTGNNNNNNNNNNSQVSLTPGGVPNPGPFNRVTAQLTAAQPNGVAFFSSIIGTAQLDAALTLAQQRGVARVESRPFCVVAEGETCNTINGTTIPVVTTAIAGGATVGVGQPSFIEASRVLAVTPQVAEDETGRPAFVTLNVRLENNTVDTSLPLFNGLPGINRQSLQTILRLRPGETAVIGGLTNDQFARALAQVPGLGRIPGIGRLFQRRLVQTTANRLYFAVTAEVVTQDQALPSAPAKLSTELPPTPNVK